MKLFRGFDIRPDVGTIHKVDKNRNPTDTCINIHDKADEVFEKYFGIQFRRNSVFCTGDYYEAFAYGKVAIIEPIGDYTICWSPFCKDFYAETHDLEINGIEDFIIKNQYQITNINQAILSKNEIMIYCNEYKIIEHMDNYNV